MISPGDRIKKLLLIERIKNVEDDVRKENQSSE